MGLDKNGTRFPSYANKQITMSQCPVCNSKSRLIKRLSSEFILRQLATYFYDSLPDDLAICNYELLRCVKCSLEFSSPLQPGSEKYYQWVTSHQNYYTKDRWEWGYVISNRFTGIKAPVYLLEIGCGSGYFLEKLKALPNIRAIGLDSTITSVKKCREKGLEVYCETIQSFIGRSNPVPEYFDYVIAFHCLEHVDNPRGLIEAMASVLKPEGRIFISTPYSPMSFETLWFDPMNHPPHHMTRWNESAYYELARQLNLKIEFYMPPATGAVDRTLTTLNYAWNGPARLVPRRSIQLAVFRHPLIAFFEWIRQLRRDRVLNQVAANNVLVELFR